MPSSLRRKVEHTVSFVILYLDFKKETIGRSKDFAMNNSLQDDLSCISTGKLYLSLL